jgi:hypothetical protein
MTDEGYIKYQAHWDKKPIEIPDDVLSEINHYRSLLMEMGMMGKIKDGSSFGNISVREQENRFYISGSDTGMLKHLCPEHMTMVTLCQPTKNQITFRGTLAASSESMSHALVYETNAASNAVIHVHHAYLWKKYCHILPTTPANIAYGTPDMALAIETLIQNNPLEQIIILGGHTDGIIGYGADLKSAFSAINEWYKRI